MLIQYRLYRTIVNYQRTKRKRVVLKIHLCLNLLYEIDDVSQLISKRFNSAVGHTHNATESVVVFGTTRVPTPPTKNLLSACVESNCLSFQMWVLNFLHGQNREIAASSNDRMYPGVVRENNRNRFHIRASQKPMHQGLWLYFLAVMIRSTSTKAITYCLKGQIDTNRLCSAILQVLPMKSPWLVTRTVFTYLNSTIGPQEDSDLMSWVLDLSCWVGLKLRL